MRTTRIKIDKALYERLKSRVEVIGYSSVDELIHHVLEREVERFAGGADAADAEKTRQRLRGLGYIS